jgi:hypothetical protein
MIEKELLDDAAKGYLPKFLEDKIEQELELNEFEEQLFELWHDHMQDELDTIYGWD